LPDSGTGNIPAFTAFNDEADSIVAVISVTPGYNGCDGKPQHFSITVYPSSIILKQPSSSSNLFG
jgi:trimeric autotransporter adhesin